MLVVNAIALSVSKGPDAPATRTGRLSATRLGWFHDTAPTKGAARLRYKLHVSQAVGLFVALRLTTQVVTRKKPAKTFGPMETTCRFDGGIPPLENTLAVDPGAVEVSLPDTSRRDQSITGHKRGLPITGASVQHLGGVAGAAHLVRKTPPQRERRVRQHGDCL
jgi:hypothetical protein